MYLEFGTPLFDEHCKDVDMIHKLMLKWDMKAVWISGRKNPRSIQHVYFLEGEDGD